MQSIMESELAYFYQQKATALNDLTALALVDEEGDAFADAILAHQNYPLYSSPHALLAMYLAQGELTEAREAVDLQRVIGDLSEYWDVQDLYLDLLEAEQTPSDVDASGIALLETIALVEGYGAGHAQAWLALLDRTNVEPIILPGGERRSMPIGTRSEHSEMHLLSVFPNPSNGAVQVAARLPEGVDVAMLRVMDPLGRLVVAKRVTGSTVLFDLPHSDVSGQYTLGLYLDGIKAEAVSFQVIR